VSMEPAIGKDSFPCHLLYPKYISHIIMYNFIEDY
jgi:hypothetical protein